MVTDAVSTIPRTRAELINLLQTSFEKLELELNSAGSTVGNLPAVDNWSVKDLLAVRAWWSMSVASWIDAGHRGEVPALPSDGYGWKETPQLNNEIVRRSRRQSYKSVRSELKHNFEQIRTRIDDLSDHELLETGVFEWAGKYPIARWISMNTARQYTTARTMVRKALREHQQG